MSVNQEQINATELNTLSKLINNSSNEVLTNLLGAGYLAGGALTDNLDGTVDIASGTGYIRRASGDTAILQYITWLASPGLTMVDGDSTYIYVEYNAGSPKIAITTTGSSIRDNENDEFELYEVVREGTALHVTAHRQYANNAITKMQQRFYSVSGVTYAASEGGLALGETGTRNVTVTTGNVWVKLDKSTIPNIDTSGSDTFDRYYRDGASGFTKQSAETQWDNANYDDGSGTLAALTANRYTTQYFYVETDGALVSMYGQAQYTTLAGAENDTPPSSAPKRIEEHALLIGRMIVQEGGATANSIESALGTLFSGTQVTDHGSLSGLADDDHAQYLLLAGRSGQTIDDDLTLTATKTLTIDGMVLSDSGIYVTGANGGVQTDQVLFLNGNTVSMNTVGIQHHAVSDANPGSVTPVSRLRHYGSGTVVDGVGTSFYLNTNNDNAQQIDHVQFEGVMTDVSDGVESSKLDLKVYENGSLITPLTVAALTQINATIGVAITSPLNLMTVNNIANENNFIVDNTSVGTIDNIQTVAKYSYTSATGIIDNGIGTRTILNAPNGDNAQVDIVKLEASMPSVTDGAEDSMYEVKTSKAGAEVSGGAFLGNDTIAGRGDIEGFAIKYNSTTGVTVTVGKCEANEKYFVLDTNAVHPMTSLAVAFDRHYIYIDDSASTTGGIPVFIDSTTAPAWSDAKQGFYNGDDRMLGFVVSDAGSAIVAYFTAIDLGGKVVQNTNENTLMSLATFMNPDSTWQTPDETESSAVLPVSAISIFIRIQNTDAGTSVRLYATAKESADASTPLDNAETRWTFFGTGTAVSPVTLGASRNIRIGGTDTNDNSLSCSIHSYKYKR